MKTLIQNNENGQLRLRTIIQVPGTWLIFLDNNKRVFLNNSIYTVVVQLKSHVQLFATPWTTAHQASLSFTISWSLLKFMSFESMMPYNCLILCCPLLLSKNPYPSLFQGIARRHLGTSTDWLPRRAASTHRKSCALKQCLW